MSVTKLEQIFRNETIWRQAIPEQVKQNSNRTFPSYFGTQSRSLNYALNHTLGYYNYGNNAFRILYSLCTLLKDNMPIKIHTRYLTISSEMAESIETNLTNYLAYPNIEARYFNFVFYHVPKGKSYLRKALDESTNGVRLKNIEAFCIEDTSHFIRIYQNYNVSGTNTITIFSDRYTNAIIYALWVMLPHLMQILPITPNDNEDVNTAYNDKVTALYDIFNLFYNVLKTTNETSYTQEELNRFQETLTECIKKYTSKFDFITTALNSFTKRLAHVKNTTAQEYFTNELARINRRITDYEQNLTSAYATKQRLQTQLLANNTTTEEDVKPFIDTITNTKAIEILRTTETEMVLRITAPLQYFQSSDFEMYEKNTHSIYNTQITDPVLKSVLHNVFVTRKYKMLVQAIIHIQINTSYTDSVLSFYAERSGCAPNFTQFPNPHLYHFNCWGAAQTEMHKNISEGNYELVIMQMVAAVQSVNIAENASFVNGLLCDIRNSESFRKLLTFIVNTPEGDIHLNYKQILEYEQNNTKETLKTIKQEYTQIEIPDTEE
jgi:hypothetical protein